MLQALFRIYSKTGYKLLTQHLIVDALKLLSHVINFRL